MWITAMANNIGARLSERKCDAGAETSVRASNQGIFAVEVESCETHWFTLPRKKMILQDSKKLSLPPPISDSAHQPLFSCLGIANQQQHQKHSSERNQSGDDHQRIK